MSFTNFLEDELLDHVFGGAAFSSPASVFVKLHTGDPGEDAAANAAGETTRIAASFGAASGGSITNDAEILWTDVSTSETYSHFSIWDAATGGNPLAYGTISPSKAVTAGEDARFAVGALTVTLD